MFVESRVVCRVDVITFYEHISLAAALFGWKVRENSMMVKNLLTQQG